ncbi:MAG: hypothetical protein ABIH00_11525 [Armatimonadota bacterium]
MINKKTCILFLLCVFISLTVQSAFSYDYQTEVNRYLTVIGQNVNELPDWEAGFERAANNIESFEECLHNISMDINEKRNTNPGYTVKIIFYNPVDERYKQLEENLNELKDYMRDLNNKYNDLNEADINNKERVLNNTAKAMTKWAEKIGKPDITDLDFSEEKKDAKILEEDFNNINNIPEAMEKIKKEYERVKPIAERTLEMLRKLKPLNSRMKEILDKYKDLGKPPKQSDHVVFLGSFKGQRAEGMFGFKLYKDGTVAGLWEGELKASYGCGPVKGTIKGAYNSKHKTIGGTLSGYYYVTLKDGSQKTYNITGDWNGRVYGNLIKGTFRHRKVLNKGTIGLDSGKFEVNLDK